MSKILHIFQSTFDFSAIDPNSTLLVDSNVDLDNLQEVFHTSLGDIEVNKLIEIASKFDCIKFHPDTYKQNQTELIIAQYCLNIISQTKIVENYSVSFPETFTDLQVCERNNSPILFSFGCSNLAPEYDNQFLKFDEVMSAQLHLPLCRVAAKGKTTSWALREIAKADIRPGDIVIWFITPNKEKIAVLDDYVYTKLPKHIPESEALDLYVKISNLHNGVNLLRAKKAKILLLSVQEFSNGYFNFFEMLSRYPEFVYTDHLCSDVASDGTHYGPKTHKSIAFALVDRV